MTEFNRSPIVWRQSMGAEAAALDSPLIGMFASVGTRRMILSHLSAEDQHAAAQVCRAWRRVIRGIPALPLVGRGAQEHYVIPHLLNRRRAAQIRLRTGLHISIAAGLSRRVLATTIDDIDPRHYCVGRGAFGVVCIGQSVEDSEIVAIKITEGEECIKAEERVQESLSGCSGVLHAYDAVRVDEKDCPPLLFQIMRLAGLGDLDQFGSAMARLAERKLFWNSVDQVGYALLRALGKMHQRNVFHLDFKPSNVVFVEPGKPKIIDPGCAILSETGQMSALRTQGDRRYWPHERWIATVADDGKDLCDAAGVDAFSCGVTLLEIHYPGQRFIDPTLVARMMELPIPGGGSRMDAIRKYYLDRLRLFPVLDSPRRGSFWSVVKGLLALSPRERLSVREAKRASCFAHAKRPALSPLVHDFLQGELTPHSSASSSPSDPPPPHFAGYVRRLDLQERARRRLLSAVASVVPLCGDPGMGKTEIAVYLYHDERISRRYHRKFFFRDADRPGELERQYGIIERELGLASDDSDQTSAVEAVVNYFDLLGSRVLLVFDHAASPEQLQPYLPRSCSSLITSLSDSWEDPITVGPFAPAESQRLVATLLGGDSGPLSEVMGRVPLCLAQVCAIGLEQDLSAQGVLAQLENDSASVNTSRSIAGRELPYSIADYYVEILGRHGGVDVLPGLHYLACFGSRGIPPQWMAELARGESPIPMPIDSLIEQGLIQRTTSDHIALGPHLHRLVWGLISESRVSAVVRGVADFFNDKMGKQHLFYPAWIPHMTRLLELCDRLRPMPDDLVAPLLLMCSRACDRLSSISELSPREEFIEQMSELVDATHGDLPELLACSVQLGRYLMRRANLNAACARLQHAAALSERMDDPGGVALAHRLLADCGAQRRDHRLARRHYETALEAARRATDLPEQTTCLLNLLRIHAAEGRVELGIESGDRALVLLRESKEDRRSELANCLHLLGEIKAGEISISHLKEACDIFGLLSNDASLAAATRVLATRVRPAEGLALNQRATDIYGRLEGGRSPSVVECLLERGDLYANLLRFSDAIQEYRRGCEAASGSETPVPDTLSQARLGPYHLALGFELEAADDLASASGALDKAVHLLRESCPQLLPHGLLQQGRVLRRSDQPDRAIDSLLRARPHLLPGSFHRARCDLELARSLIDAGDRVSAETYAAAAVHGFRSLGADHWLPTAKSLFVLGAMESGPDAVAHLTEAAALWRRHGGRHPLQMASVLRQLATKRPASRRALEENRRACGIFEAHNRAGEAAECWLDRGDILAYLHDFPTSDFAYHRGLQLLPRIETSFSAARQGLRALVNGMASVGARQWRAAIGSFDISEPLLRVHVPELIDFLFSEKGRSLCRTGQTDAGLAYLMRCPALLAARTPVPHNRLAAVWRNIALARCTLGRRDEATTAFEEWLRHVEAGWGNNSAEAAASHQELAEHFRGLGRTAQVIQHLRAAMDIRAGLPGHDPLATAGNYVALAELYGWNCRGEAVLALQRARRIYVAQKGATSVEVDRCDHQIQQYENRALLVLFYVGRMYRWALFMLDTILGALRRRRER